MDRRTAADGAGRRAQEDSSVKVAVNHRPARWVSIVVSLLTVAAEAGQQPDASSFSASRARQEVFLSTASVLSEAPADGRRFWRARLGDGTTRHDASVETSDGSDRTLRDFRFNVAAYELDKLIGLNMVVPSVERAVNGRPASLTWWVDDFAMNELDRRRKRIDPLDPDRWTRQMQAVRVFDELISNTYRSTSPALYLNTVWDNLLITSDWTVWIIDHTRAFQIRAALEDPDSLTRCPRTVLDALRALDRAELERALGRYLSSPQLDALEARRALLVSHFEAHIAARGEAAVLYDLGPRP